MSLLAPEVILQNSVEGIIQFLEEEFNNATDKTTTTLYKFWNGVSYGRYDMYEQAQAVFLAKKDNPRRLEVRPSYDSQRAGIPTIYINLPSESQGEDGIGVDEGFQDADYDDDNLVYSTNYTRRFATIYNIVIQSDNRNEVILIYHTLRAMLIPLFDHLELSGLENIKLAGRDLQIYHDITSNALFTRAISVTLSYDVTVDNIFDKQMIQNITFKGTPYLPQQFNLELDDESESI